MAQGGTWSSILYKVFGQKLELDFLVFVLARVILFPTGPHGQDVQDGRVLAQSLLLPMLTTRLAEEILAPSPSCNTRSQMKALY